MAHNNPLGPDPEAKLARLLKILLQQATCQLQKPAYIFELGKGGKVAVSEWLISTT